MRKAVEADVDTGSERTCIVTRTKGEPETMIRFVVGPNGQVVPDLKHKLPGRGVWVTARADKVAEAVKRKAFTRGFRTEVVVSAALPAEIEALLTTECIQAFGLANKAGQVVTGFAKVEAAIEKGGIAGLVEATDAGADGGRKLRQAVLRRFGSEAVKPQVKLFTSLQLSLALGHTNVIHAALIEGSAARAFLLRCRRLDLYRSAPGAGGATDEKAAPEFV